MDYPLTNQGPHTFTFKIGAKRARKSSQSNLSISGSLSTNHMRALRVAGDPDWQTSSVASIHGVTRGEERTADARGA